jgi:hypothetical protein
MVREDRDRAVSHGPRLMGMFTATTGCCRARGRVEDDRILGEEAADEITPARPGLERRAGRPDRGAGGGAGEAPG